jgi:acyl-CoA thioester hydrolase
MDVIEGFRFQVRFPLKWGEMDALGHLNNTSYFRFVEESRIAYFAELGLLPVRTGIGPILATAMCDFRRTIVWPADVVAATRATKVGTTSITLETAIATAADLPKISALAKSVVVMLDYDTGKKVSVSAEVRAKIAKIDPAAEGLTPKK